MPASRSTYLAPIAVALLLAGCSISKSISSPFEWSSDSIASSSRSSSKDRGQSYRDDVRDYTKAYVQSGGADFASYTSGLGRIAAKHGVSDWSADEDTFVGIGAGLKQAGVKLADLEVWKTNLAGTDASKAASIQRGYDATK